MTYILKRPRAMAFSKIRQVHRNWVKIWGFYFDLENFPFKCLFKKPESPWKKLSERVVCLRIKDHQRMNIASVYEIETWIVRVSGRLRYGVLIKLFRSKISWPTGRSVTLEWCKKGNFLISHLGMNFSTHPTTVGVLPYSSLICSGQVETEHQY